ncbi:hypothetical protein XELAEV_18025904mg [Xenopus laevis]|uniref:Uncharacterized protein n=1 Tax=Xenopus laevis TaxID=8355 RepID=A0A974D0J5_XENLA|nr:hypothetical protein XELAEV_18025904mg [Xenopus laevis]
MLITNCTSPTKSRWTHFILASNVLVSPLCVRINIPDLRGKGIYFGDLHIHEAYDQLVGLPAHPFITQTCVKSTPCVATRIYSDTCCRL